MAVQSPSELLLFLSPGEHLAPRALGNATCNVQLGCSRTQKVRSVLRHVASKFADLDVAALRLIPRRADGALMPGSGWAAGDGLTVGMLWLHLGSPERFECAYDIKPPCSAQPSSAKPAKPAAKRASTGGAAAPRAGAGLSCKAAAAARRATAAPRSSGGSDVADPSSPPRGIGAAFGEGSPTSSADGARTPPTVRDEGSPRTAHTPTAGLVVVGASLAAVPGPEPGDAEGTHLYAKPHAPSDNAAAPGLLAAQLPGAALRERGLDAVLCLQAPAAAPPAGASPSRCGLHAAGTLAESVNFPGTWPPTDELENVPPHELSLADPMQFEPDLAPDLQPQPPPRRPHASAQAQLRFDQVEMAGRALPTAGGAAGYVGWAAGSGENQAEVSLDAFELLEQTATVDLAAHFLALIDGVSHGSSQPALVGARPGAAMAGCEQAQLGGPSLFSLVTGGGAAPGPASAMDSAMDWEGPLPAGLAPWPLDLALAPAAASSRAHAPASASGGAGAVGDVCEPGQKRALELGSEGLPGLDDYAQELPADVSSLSAELRALGMPIDVDLRCMELELELDAGCGGSSGRREACPRAQLSAELRAIFGVDEAGGDFDESALVDDLLCCKELLAADGEGFGFGCEASPFRLGAGAPVSDLVAELAAEEAAALLEARLPPPPRLPYPSSAPSRAAAPALASAWAPSVAAPLPLAPALLPKAARSVAAKPAAKAKSPALAAKPAAKTASESRPSAAAAAAAKPPSTKPPAAAVTTAAAAAAAAARSVPARPPAAAVVAAAAGTAGAAAAAGEPPTKKFRFGSHGRGSVVKAPPAVAEGLGAPRAPSPAPPAPRKPEDVPAAAAADGGMAKASALNLFAQRRLDAAAAAAATAPRRPGVAAAAASPTSAAAAGRWGSAALPRAVPPPPPPPTRLPQHQQRPPALPQSPSPAGAWPTPIGLPPPPPPPSQQQQQLPPQFHHPPYRQLLPSPPPRPF
ncbi:hypothetical protein T492DRAFT_874898 [Pavlovales sp. CCMP2436]|nr:hypothetical protein T492DRAFT_874898 [Pavlovales sp. CCMP2436]